MGWITLLIAIPVILLGAHGLYAYFQRADTFFGIITGNYDKLFFSITVPQQLSGLVSWMTLRGAQSFIIPAVLIIFGLWLGQYSLSHGLHFSLPKFRPKRTYRPFTPSQPLRPKTIAKKILLNIVILIGTVLLAWFGYKVFTHKASPMIGALLFLSCTAVLGLLIWLFRRKYISSGPSFKVTALIVAFIVVVFALAGVEPLSSMKDNAVQFITSWFSRY